VSTIKKKSNHQNSWKDTFGKYLVPFTLITLPSLFNFIVVLNLFYQWGAYYLDAGVQQYSLCNNSFGEMPPAHQSFWGHESIFYIHGIYTPAMLCGALTLLTGNSVLSFAIFCALQTLLVSVTSFLVLRKISNSALFSSVSGFLLGFSSFTLGQMGYPHFELLGSALIALGAWFYLFQSNNLGLLFVLLGCLSKEDMGAHLVLTIIIFLLVSERNLVSFKNQKIRVLTYTSLFGLILNVVLSKFFFESGSLLFRMQYVGDPPFAILQNPIQLLQRCSIWLSANPGITSMLILFLLGYLLTDQKLFLALFLTPWPWILINLISPDPAKQTLGIYHGYPFIIYICTHLILFNFKSIPALINWKSISGKLLIFALIANSFFSIAAALPSGASYLFYYNLRDMPVSFNTVRTTTRELEKLSVEINKSNSILIDDAVASIITKNDTKILNENTLIESSGVEILVYFPNYVLGKSLRDRLVLQSNLTSKYCILGTNIEILAKPGKDVSEMGLKTKKC
jgi:hypothetical protein